MCFESAGRREIERFDVAEGLQGLEDQRNNFAVGLEVQRILFAHKWDRMSGPGRMWLRLQEDSRLRLLGVESSLGV